MRLCDEERLFCSMCTAGRFQHCLLESALQLDRLKRERVVEWWLMMSCEWTTIANQSASSLHTEKNTHNISLAAWATRSTGAAR